MKLMLASNALWVCSAWTSRHISKGTTSSWASPLFLYDQPTLLYLAQGLRQAAILKQRVYVRVYPNKPYSITSVIFSGYTRN